MKVNHFVHVFLFLGLGFVHYSCSDKVTKVSEMPVDQVSHIPIRHQGMGNDDRISLHLNPMQKQHQLMNMRSHLEAVQNIVFLLSSGRYDEASEVAYKQLGSTTEMRLMCASFGDKGFENMGLEFHKSADRMSEVFKSMDRQKSLEALSVTLNYCVLCHSTYRQ